MSANRHGPNFSYQTFCHYLPRTTGASSSPTDAENINPQIKRILGCYPDSTIYGAGGHSALLSISDSSCISSSWNFTRTVLHERLNSNKAPRPPVLQWMQQLLEAVACLEALGYAHGDINPRNIMVTEDDHLRLIDFDHSLKLGEDLEVGDYPHVRPISMAENTAQPGGTFSVASAATELFALGSIFWYMVRGTELWAGVQGLDLVDRLTARTCPEMDLEDPVNRIIRECWTGRFGSVAALAASLHPPAGVFERS
ncbi:hypothetical protein H113_06647 [Trichophyton rubrum MR1459]|uniref:Protein kinase domain-containing protein n=1 Tax=Trichophyton rubrum (strain ATCC MYA-4607 / CBS 118892) TaxID=559305 RepID=F2SIW7_TRIRC|nr:uncharacterized protein TERG_01950 [Trichophyton rubrum CBS 118892]EZF12475.1 hypothetical protein H100_06611 [Trichophyton rubrum MR850]EZF39239.1 hypothetical protein H102_06577 [Trichophyton rubrum CBS 100081]EZF92358.1 hypothetical protein H113_06647 [Trichophyton rubrum MR1459]EZG02908.1 hypothetical protein H106_06443 [Trichophyton rubrum CBS 735.88]EZG14059.1 hypothetical protein H107_06749 [Trichophyton rubrum CBS 202.88]KMQ48353.1 Protein kinase domain [Trichophyton rubrum]